MKQGKKIETKEIKRSIGHYIIYTESGIYLFNGFTGDFERVQMNE